MESMTLGDDPDVKITATRADEHSTEVDAEEEGRKRTARKVVQTDRGMMLQKTAVICHANWTNHTQKSSTHQTMHVA